ncbi:L-2-hydroxyglutarate oxidase LhgO [bacterium BMS3Bbin10]|nr:L-2-hydroxyglutarate oxidase LhgO [bacterium BMS3Bbin10]HDL16567.1 L-2-hydroxyglutarate oxidase [Hyphomicrobiales bacterium]
MYDYTIIGGGILGLATAYRLLRERPSARLVVLEKEQGLARHQTGHNSGVIHAGVYYTPGSLKAKLCREGAERTVRFCEEHAIPHERCGKLIVATGTEEIARLKDLEDRVVANGLDYERVSGGRLREIEPNVTGAGALLVHATGIVDYARICRRLAELIREAGGEIRLGAGVTGITESDAEITAQTGAGDFTSRTLIVCAGLQGDRLAMMAGLDIDFRVLPFRGEYYRIAAARGELVKRLIYPVPDPSLPFLGVHLTKIIDGSLTVGPNAMLSLGRETYSGNYPVPRDMADMMSFPGFYKLMARFAAAGIYELRGSLSKQVYLERCRKYCPSLELDDLEYLEPGIRAQNVSSDGKLIDDFLFLETPRSLHLCNAPSPAATSALPIADEIVSRALRKAN